MFRLFMISILITAIGVPTLAGERPRRSASSRIFTTQTGPNGATGVLFGNGVAGQRLPNSGSNVIAGAYRTGGSFGVLHFPWK